jgi:hypothetical protein
LGFSFHFPGNSDIPCHEMVTAASQIRRARHSDPAAVQGCQVASMKVGSLPKSQIYDWVESVL